MKYPFFRIAGRCGDITVERVEAPVDTTAPHYDPDDSWTHTVKLTKLAHVRTHASALAVLRLHGAREYHDWTKKGAHWDMPMTRTPEDA